MPDGKYADTDLILCASADNPDVAVAQLQAQYIKYGPMVYQFNTPEELGAALSAIDAESTHDAVALYKEEETRRKARETGTLEPENPVPAPDKVEEPPPAEETQEEEVQEESPLPAEEDEAVVPTAEEPVLPDSAPEEPAAPEPAPPLPETPSGDGEVLGATDTPVLEEPSAVDISTTTTE